MPHADLQARFNSIMTRGAKTNTYKFALAKFLIDYTDNFSESEIRDMVRHKRPAVIKYSNTAKAFLQYYWHQECKYRIRQSSDPKKLPYVIQIIREEFDDSDAKKSFSELPESKVKRATDLIQSRVFGKGGYSHVVPRFQNLKNQNKDEKNIFYDYDSDHMTLRPESLLFFKANKQCLTKTVILEWSKFLERRNNMPMLISKIENYRARRGALTKYKKMFERDFCRCFYCECTLRNKFVHVDHFIPWSYVFEDEAWNLVLSCPACNLKKHDSLAQKPFLNNLIDRNYQYGPEIVELGTSLKDLGINARAEKSTLHTWEGGIKSQYENCIEYGFSVIKMP